MIRSKLAGPIFSLACAAMFFFLAFERSAQAGTILGPTVITNDATSGVSSSFTYTHLLDFINDGAPAVINGVAWTAADRNGGNWSSTNISGTIPEASGDGGGVPVSGAVPAGSGIAKLLADFFYDGSGIAGNTETITLSGLTPGKVYQADVYYRNWDHTQFRSTVLTFDEGSPQSITIDQNDFGPNTNLARYVSYRYTAGAGGTLLMSMRENNNVPTGSWHDYGVSNHLVPEPSSIVLGGLGLIGILLARRYRK